MSVVYPIYTSLTARNRSAPVEGETVLLKTSILLADFPTPVVQLCSYLDGEWVVLTTYAEPEVVTRAMTGIGSYSKLPPPPEEPEPVPPKITLEEHLAQHQPNTA
jgi:hypothetical protein